MRSSMIAASPIVGFCRPSLDFDTPERQSMARLLAHSRFEQRTWLD